MSIAKRLLVGRPMHSENLGETLLQKRIALPIFASDPLSSVAYATEAILKVLTLGGLAYLYLTPWIGLAVVGLLTVVVISYRQVVMAYPGGGGSYEVVRENLGERAAMVVAASLMVDYVMTVAVSVAAGVDNIISAFPGLNGQRLEIALGIVVVLTVMNLRGTRESGRAFAVPTYVFVTAILAVIAVGLGQTLLGHAPVAESVGYGFHAEQTGLTGLALAFLALKAFSSGCTALTGVEAISNGVPAFRPPKARNAARTLMAMGVLAVAMFSGITVLSLIAGVHVAEETCDLTGFPGDCESDPQQTVIAQLATAVFGAGSVMFYVVQAATALVLILAANTAYNGFPMLTQLLARHRLMPTQLRTRGDRLAYSNGIVALAMVSGLLLAVYRADVDQLLHLYILGVFTSFTLSQLGMVRHWNRQLDVVIAPGVRSRINVARVINAVGATFTGLVLVIVLATKFTGGAYLVVIAVPLLCLAMRWVSRHYAKVTEELRPASESRVLPSRVHAVVLVSKVNEPVLRAISYARATRPSSLTALTVCVDADEVRDLQRDWVAEDLPVPLTLLDSPFRDVTDPIVDHVLRMRSDNPRDLVVVFIPEYVVDRWWEGLLHNQSALRIKLRLLTVPGVVVTSVPYHLEAEGPVRTRTPQDA
ncbi:APC family permease [Terrabacter sp. MAHUQ-38]|nr:APC family permease [Terrabacter sp. MAHUQ-38]MBC9820722.1 APC family permease [Terrabacter sp. MAHUQ-38]